MADPKGEGLKLGFDGSLRLGFHGAKITSDAGLLAYRDLDEALALFDSVPSVFHDSRTGRNIQHDLTALLRQSVYSRLVVWCGEFGRSPDNGVGGGVAYGRDHNNKALTIWFAGGGVKAGHTVGATDDLGARAVENVHHIRDIHVTILRLLGLDDNKLTYFHGGRFKQLSQFGGQVIEELLA